MACGTGKTLVALWVAEKMGCQTVLVLVPSLALVQQTLQEWLHETAWENLIYLCVCSDKTVTRGLDAWTLSQSDLDFSPTTEPKEVRRFLKHPYTGTKIVFSTYDSATVVADGMRRTDNFDLGVFDEAHKTASHEGGKFSFALSDANLKIRKRLFLTATPRHYDVQKKDKEGDVRLVYSMDDPVVYGARAHTLTFAQAAGEKIICDYKIVISVVTSEMVSDELLQRGETIVEGEVVKADHVARQIALKEAARKYRVKRIFTVHANVNAAQSFIATGGEGIQSHMRGLSVFHVNGKMRIADRKDQLEEFSESKKSIVTNARCLTEGVDVPAVDMVGFMSPRKSKVDIVQATGRAMRKDPSNEKKATGYILIPLFLQEAKGETVEEALERTSFDELRGVLSAMRDQDGDLAEIIRGMLEERGRTGGYRESRLREKVEVVGPRISLALLRSAITSRCVEWLGATWDERHGELKSFKRRFGHCNVPNRWSKHPKLATWVIVQRKNHTKGKLSQDKFDRLDAIGFVWRVR